MLARRLSQAVERSGQHARELEQLEQLGRAIIAAPPDASTLPEMLATFVPPRFLYKRIEIKLYSGQTLLHMPTRAPGIAAALWDWLRHADRPHAFALGQRLPWDEQVATGALAAAPIISLDAAEHIGGICIAFSPAVDDPAP